MTNVPAEYQGYVNNAAAALGISPNVVAAQISLESSWNPNARSPAGAVGIAQFLPSTFRSYGTGSPFNVPDAFNAYTNYMRSLLNDFHGDLRSALAAYNAGPGNIGAGMGYASHILSAAGSGDVTVPGTGGGGGGDVQQATNMFDNGTLGGAILGFITKFFPTLAQQPGAANIPGVQAVAGVMDDAGNLLHAMVWLAKPSSWLRIGAFFVGVLALGVGTWALISTVRNK